MPRPPRLLLSQSYYHIMTRGNNRKTVFETSDDFLYYLNLVRKYKMEHPFDLYHYCLMSNHTHFLIKINKATDFSKFMKRLNLAYFHYYRKNYGWVGHFWQDRFKSQAVGKDEYFIQCGKYIELNPLRAGIVTDPREYEYSSYNYYASNSINNLLTEDFQYSEIGNTQQARQEEYRKMVIGEIVFSSRKKFVWGSNYQQYHENQKRKYNLK